MAKVGQEIDARNAGWTFEGIAGQFDEHVRLSVPLYDEGHELACRLGDFFLPPGRDGRRAGHVDRSAGEEVSRPSPSPGATSGTSASTGSTG